jgi:hypothetical protein
LTATKETIQDVLGLEDINASQSDLFKAIERWGKAQISAEQNCNEDELREMVDSCIKQIWFMSMEVKEFAELSTSTNVLSIEEKYWILLAIVQNEPQYIPKKFNQSNSRHLSPRNAPFSSLSAIICNTNYICCGTLANTALKFSVSQSATLLGLEIDIDLNSTQALRRAPIAFPPSSTGFQNMGFTVSDNMGVIVAVGNTSNRRKVGDRNIVLVSPPTVLQIGHQYALCFTPIPAPHYFFEIRNGYKSELLISSTEQTNTLQSPIHIRQGAVVASSWRDGPSSAYPTQIPNKLFEKLKLKRELQANNRQRKIPIIATEQRVLQENEVNFQIHGRFSSAPILGFIFDKY